MPTSVTALMPPVPDWRVTVTVAPPVVSALPFASSAVTVRTWVLIPSAVMLALVGVSVERAASDQLLEDPVEPHPHELAEAVVVDLEGVSLPEP